MERIITNLTKEEVDLLGDNDIEWYPDDILAWILQNCETFDVCIDSESEYEKAMDILGRKK